MMQTFERIWGNKSAYMEIQAETKLNVVLLSLIKSMKNELFCLYRYGLKLSIL
jgi:hypothetical protein